jgi:glycolate oxidase
VISPSFVKDLRRAVGRQNVLTRPVDLALYAYDSSIARGRPEAVVFVHSTAEVSAVVRLCAFHRLPFVARGAGTNLSGGSVPIRGGVVVELSRLNRILDIDTASQCAVVEPGVVNLDLQNALAPHGYTFCPDPASQQASTIGGNAAENAGGPHGLKYGVTSHHVLGLELVLPDGNVITTGGKSRDVPGYDLTGLLVGSEGTLGIITSLVLRIVPLPETTITILAAFDSLEAASRAVSEIIAAGMIPAALEMMDRVVIRAVEQTMASGYPPDAEAVLIIELEGLKEALPPEAEQVEAICRRHGARELRRAADAAERTRLWAGRKGAFGAMSSISTFLVSDGTVPRSRLPEMLRRAEKIARRHGLEVGHVFHAGDGNLHPNIFFDPGRPEQRARAIRAATEMLEACAELGGTISGEHGVGIEKMHAMSLIFSEADLAAMRQVKEVFDPAGLANPGKILPPPAARKEIQP